MKKLLPPLLLALLVVGCMCFSQEVSIDSNTNKKNNLSFGLMDSRTGNTFVSFSYDYYQKEKNEMFIGFGTFIINTNISLGWKHYFSKNTFSPFLVTSLHITALTIDLWNKDKQTIGIFPTITIGVERKFLKKYSAQCGLFLASMKTEYGLDYAIWPCVNVDYRF